MQAKEFDFSRPHKLSKVAFLMLIGKISKQALPIVLVMVGSKLLKNNNSDWQGAKSLYYFLGLYLVFLLAHLKQFLQYLRFSFYIDKGELIEESGVFSKTKTSIPLNRIQSVHLTQNYFHRLFNTCELKLETAGSDQTEFVLKAINRDKALALQELLQNKIAATVEQKENSTIIGIKFSDLLKLFISENHLKTLVLILFFVIARLDDLRQLFGINADDYIENQVKHISPSIQLTLMLTAFVLLTTLIVSFVRVLIRYHNMELSLADNGFKMQWGFFQTQQKHLVQSKVQLIGWNQNFLRKILGIYILRFYMAGEDQTKESVRIQLPVMQEKILSQLITSYQAVLPADHVNAQKIHRSYGWRKTILFVLPIYLILSTALYFWHPVYIIFPSLILIYLFIHNILAQRNYKYWINNNTLQIEKGVWERENTLLNLKNVQHVVVKTSPFLRSKNLATLVLHSAGDQIVIPFLPVHKANYIADLCLVKVEFSDSV